MTNMNRDTRRHGVTETTKPRLQRHQRAAIRREAREANANDGPVQAKRMARAAVKEAKYNKGIRVKPAK